MASSRRRSALSQRVDRGSAARAREDSHHEQPILRHQHPDPTKCVHWLRAALSGRMVTGEDEVTTLRRRALASRTPWCARRHLRLRQPHQQAARASTGVRVPQPTCRSATAASVTRKSTAATTSASPARTIGCRTRWLTRLRPGAFPESSRYTAPMNWSTDTTIAVLGSIAIALVGGFLEGAAFWVTALIILVVEIAAIMTMGRRPGT